MVEVIDKIKTDYFNRKFQILMSCCGHGKYPMTLVVRNRASRYVFEWFSGVSLTKGTKYRKRQPYYKKDEEGYYYIPEVMENIKDDGNRL